MHLHSREADDLKRNQVEPEAKPNLEQLYASQYGYFFRFLFGLKGPVDRFKIRKREALRLFLIGLLIRCGLAKIQRREYG